MSPGDDLSQDLQLLELASTPLQYDHSDPIITLEEELLPVLAQMEDRGIRLDREALSDI